jgi:hypothetical protein
VSYLEELAQALAERRVPARRILLEVEDHLRCDPAAAGRLGDPRELAAQFAEGLAASRSRRAAAASFVALALTAGALVATQQSLGASPDIFSGTSFALAALAGLGVAVAPQIAFVAGMLALQQAWRLYGRDAVPAAELRLLQRRAAVGVAAGGATAGGIVLYAVNFWGQLPSWWAALSVAAAATSALALGAAAATISRAAQPVAVLPGGTVDPIDELGPLARPLAPLRGRPWRLAAVTGSAVTLAMLLVGWRAESSLGEGVFRAAVEAAAFAAGFLLLGRLLGLRGR